MDAITATVLTTVLNDTVSPILQTAILAGVGFVITRVFKRLGIDINAKKRDQAGSIIMDAIAYAQEETEKYKKSTGQISPKKKIDYAIEFALNRIPRMSPKEASDLIHAKLGRTPGVGATGERAVE